MDGTITTTDFTLPGQTNVYHGKVRDTYTIGTDYLVAIASDRISAFDVILPRAIPYKGQVLNQIAAHFLRATSDIAPNWLLSIPDPNVSIGTLCEPFKIEMVVRGCLVGHSWREYSAGKRQLCGETMPDGLQEYDEFPEPLITPSTKAESGHDQDISHADIVTSGLSTAAEFKQLCTLARSLFERGQAMAVEQGLYLADTKYEFGKRDGTIYVIDEIHTPDSSRYFTLSSYQSYIKDRKTTPRHLSKEFVREWLLEHNFSGQSGQVMPTMTDEIVASITERYIDLYQQITGKAFVPADTDSVQQRLEANITNALKEL